MRDCDRELWLIRSKQLQREVRAVSIAKMRARGFKIISALLISALFSGHANQAFAKTVVLAPSSPWAINYADDSCELARAFGEGKDRTTIHFMRYEPGDKFRLTLVGRHARARELMKDVKVQFGPTGVPFSASASRGTANVGQPALIFTQFITIAASDAEPPDDIRWSGFDATDPYKIAPEQERAVTEIAFLTSLTNEVHLETGGLAEPFAALRACNDELLSHWGIDVEKHRSLSRPAIPIGSPGSWMSAGDYPVEMLRAGFDGLVHFRLIVEASGEVSECVIQDALEPKEFSKVTCDRIKRRAKFEAARDASGQPIKSYWISTVRWSIEN